MKIATDEEICGPVDGEPLSSGPDRRPPQTRRKFGFMGMMARMQAYDVWRVEEMERMHEEAIRVRFAAELPDTEAVLFPCSPPIGLQSPEHTLASPSMPRQRNQDCEDTPSDYGTSRDADSVCSDSSGYVSTAAPGDGSFVVDDNPDCLPTLRVWTSLAAHMAEENIPDPVAFVNQYDAVTRLVCWSLIISFS